MDNIVNSSFLDKLIRNAVNMSKDKRKSLTAEKVLASALNFSLIPVAFLRLDANQRDEFENMCSVISKHFTQREKAEKILSLYINKYKMIFMLDDLSMERKQNMLKILAYKEGKKEVTANDMISALLAEPSEIIAYVLEVAGNTPSSESAESCFEQLEKRFSAKLVPIDSDAYRAFQDSVKEREEKTVPAFEKTDTFKTDDSESVFGDAISARTEVASIVTLTEKLRGELSSSIFGQDNAVNTFITGWFRSKTLELFDKNRRRPCSFLFAGPPGVGKTFLAESVAKSEMINLPCKRFDMSEYADDDAHLEFCGFDKAYRGAKAGNVTGFAAKHPKSVIIFDEIEKAHSCVINLFLQILDAGILRDNYTDEKVSFTDTIVIMTTNAGKQLYEDSESANLSSIPRKVILNALRTDINPTTKAPFFPAAICSRFASGNIVMFNHIEAHDLVNIARKEVESNAQRYTKQAGIKFNISDRVYTALLLSEGSKADARVIRARGESFFNDEIHELFRLVSSKKVVSGVDSIENIDIDLDLSNADTEITNLFESEERTSVLVYADPDTAQKFEKNAPFANVVSVADYESAVRAVKEYDIDIAVIDFTYGAKSVRRNNLNIEDIESPARDFYAFLSENKKNIPVFLFELESLRMSDEERVSFIGQGIRGVIDAAQNDDALSEQVRKICDSIYRQRSLLKLAKENKVVSFKTAQTVSDDGRYAQIRLYSFKMSVAVDAEDTENIMSSVSKPNVHFEDVIGARDAKKELQYFVEYLKNPKKYMGTGVKAPKGILLYGPPGTGKTMLAKAMANEAGVTFIAAEGNRFSMKYTGEGAELIHKYFRMARKYSPSVLFIDEIDVIAKNRMTGESNGGIAETLTALLTEMDGFVNDPSKPVFVLAATNFNADNNGESRLDPALLRRFDRRILIDLPDREDRIRFLNKKVEKNKALVISLEKIENIALRSTGMSLADLESATELALRSAIRQGSTVVTDEIYEEAFETYVNGEVKDWDGRQIERTARHEAGHALISWLGGRTPSYLTIVARGNHGGYMLYAEKEESGVRTKDYLLDRICTSLGGRAAEIVCYGAQDGLGTGASADLANATNVAKHILCSYGMDSDFGLAVIDPDAYRIGSEMSLEIKAGINRILSQQLERAVRLITENKDKLDALVDELIAKNHLNENEITQILK